MKRLSALFIALALFVVPCLAQEGGYFSYGLEVVELFYPSKENPVYNFQCEYPVIDSDSLVAEQINEFFRLAVTELRDLTIPMYSNDDELGKTTGNVITQKYEVTVNTEKFFGTLMRQKQTINGEEKESLFSQVFASSGPYAGQTLTLRGALGEIGESSEQIAELILEDVFKTLADNKKPEDAVILEGLTLDDLYLDFYPEAQFFMNSEEEIVFYFLPETTLGKLSTTTFVYNAQKIGELLENK